MYRHHSSDEEYRAFWASVDAAVQEVAKWPEWKIDRVQAARFAKAGSGEDSSSDDPRRSEATHHAAAGSRDAERYARAERGHYSLIQFVPDRGRAEGANVGVVVVCPKLSAARVLICEGSEAPRERFGAAVVEQWRLESATVALKHRLLAELSEQPTLETLERVRRLEGNALTLTPPRTVAVDDIDRVAAKLLVELVRIPDPRGQEIL